MKTKLMLLTALLSFSLLCTANAALIEEWSYVTDVGFSAWTGSDDDADYSVTGSQSTTGGLFTPTLDRHLAWGHPFSGGEQSSLHIDESVPGTASTGSWAEGTTITHNNHVITAGTGSLLTAKISDVLQLTPTEPTSTPINAPTLSFDIHFYETPNDSNPCADGGTHGVGINGNGCGDIFGLTLPTGLVFEWQTATSFMFTVPLLETSDYNYYITTQLSNMTILSDSAKDALGSGFVGDVGFVTAEEASNNMFAHFIITTDIPTAPIPEPSTFLLLGAGLLGLGLRARRRK